MNTDKSARTPGPWTVEFGEAMYVRAPDGSHIAIMGQLTAHARRDPKESAANARSFAAVPQMAEALEAAEQCIGELQPTQARVEAMQMIQAALTLAQEAQTRRTVQIHQETGSISTEETTK